MSAPAEAPTDAVASNGITHPSGIGRTASFVTDVLVALGYVGAERVEAAVGESRLAGKPPERLLLEQNAIDARQLSRAIAERYGLDHVDLSVFPVDMAAANLLPISSARRYQAVPIGYVDKETLRVAMADPANVLAADDIKMATGLRCQMVVADAADIESLLSRVNSLQSAVTEAIAGESSASVEVGDSLDPLDALSASADDAPVVKLVYSILGQAVNEGVSDIHFEPEQEDMRVRFRVDGVLHEAAHVPKRMVSAVVSRIKIMSELDIAERRIPQDGRVGVTVDDSRVDLRVTTLPTQRGEGATIRILDTRNAMRSLDQLGMNPEAREPFEAAVRRPYGAVLVTGPTGSGKSTTLYAALAAINGVERNVITIEDPVEYQIDGVNQINVNPKAGLTFASGLRSILRADPDVIMVGEIRDAETARIGIEAALTGHLVLSTLHTNDAPGTITRLAKMGIESFLTASAIDCIVAQRLARTLCPNCKQRAVISPKSLAEAGFGSATGMEAFEAVGCSRCGNTGYRGRVGLYSVMRMTERIKDMTVNQASQAEISTVARQEGMATLREDGLSKARLGLTSFDEVVRVTT
ncbi:MAG: Flp pilus assembly complex ATPase component TadA [Actinobacteria bacterium]|nr:Flp pilus assembly complex ATPase component TadA [Actinomycetota bacterium]